MNRIYTNIHPTMSALNNQNGLIYLIKRAFDDGDLSPYHIGGEMDLPFQFVIIVPQ